MTRDRAFLQAILDSPDDDAPRLVYADWLEERGDPRGEFIRLQCALAGMDEEDPRRPGLRERVDRLTAAHGPAWAGPLPEWAVGPEFHRGFMEVVQVDVEQLLLTISRIVEGRSSDVGPAPRLKARLLGPAVGSPLLRLVRGIRVRGLPSSYRAVWPILPFLVTGDDLLRSPELAGLSALDLEGNELGDAGVESLLFLLRRGEVGIQLLNLRFNYLTPRGAQELATSPVVAALRDLDLGINLLGPAGAVVLARSAYLRRLHALKLDDCRLGTAGVRALVDSPLLGQLTTLDLGSNGLGDPGVVALAETSAVRGLTTLTLNNNGVGDIGADALLRSANLDGLQALRLLNNWSISTELRLALRERFGDRVRL